MFLLLFGLGGVAFITLLERKYLGLRQIRLGPNKITIFGIFQPVFDGIKLLFKQNLLVFSRQRITFFLSPIILIILYIFVFV